MYSKEPTTSSMPLGTSMLLPVSVIIPSYRRPALTAQAVLSVYRQSSLPREIFVLDDASGPGFAELQRHCLWLIEHFRGSPQAAVRLRIETLPKHLGRPGALRNIAARRACPGSEWLAFLDSDDIWLPQKLQLQWLRQESSGARVLHCREIWLRFEQPGNAAAHPVECPTQQSETHVQELLQMLCRQSGTGFATMAQSKDFVRQLLLPPAPSRTLSGTACQQDFAIDTISVTARIISQKKHKQLRQGSPRQLWPHALKKCILGPSTLLLHRSVFQISGYFLPQLQIAEDYECFLRIIARFPVAYCPESLVVKRDRIPAGLTSQSAGRNDHRVPQLSHLYPWIEPFRLAALESLLSSPRGTRLLSEFQRHSAQDELLRKLTICLSGTRKKLAAPSAELSITQAKRQRLQAEIQELEGKQKFWRENWGKL